MPSIGHFILIALLSSTVMSTPYPNKIHSRSETICDERIFDICANVGSVICCDEKNLLSCVEGNINVFHPGTCTGACVVENDHNSDVCMGSVVGIS
jgi:hypothetical protein